jgi:hypothetical protein
MRDIQLSCYISRFAWYKASSSSGPTFHCFPTLLHELRLRIWHFALQNPYMINLHIGWQFDPYLNACNEYLYASSNIPRPLLFVNWVARTAAHMRALREVHLVTWDELKWSGTWISWKNRSLRSDLDTLTSMANLASTYQNQ